MGTKFFIAVGVFAVELLACQVSLACVKKKKDSSINVIDIILG